MRKILTAGMIVLLCTIGAAQVNWGSASYTVTDHGTTGYGTNNFAVSYADGTSVNYYSDGTTVTHYPDGRVERGVISIDNTDAADIQTNVDQIYTGDWCSFEIPSEWTVCFENESLVTIWGYSKDGFREQIVVKRLVGVPSAEDTLIYSLDQQCEDIVHRMQEDGFYGICTSSETQIYRPPETNYTTVVYTQNFINPNATLGGYSWGYETSDTTEIDVVVMTLTECDFTAETWDTNEFSSQLKTAYQTFTYYQEPD